MTVDKATPAAITAALLALADERAPDRTACPSEAARRFAGEDGDWRALMPACTRPPSSSPPPDTSS